MERFFLTKNKSYTITLCNSVSYTPYNIMSRHLRKFRQLNAQIRERNLKREAEQIPPSCSNHSEQPVTSNQ